MPRPFELFSGYDFFSVFLPGLAASILAVLFLPAEIASQIGPLAALVPVLVLSFSLGQGLHAVAHWLEKKAGEMSFLTPHRELFSEQVRNPTFLSEPIVKKFKSKVAEELMTDEGSNSSAEDEMIGVDWKEIYTFVQSYVYTYEIGRSRKFQSIYSFCRSMMVLSIFFPVAAAAHSTMSFWEYYSTERPSIQCISMGSGISSGLLRF